MLLKKTAPTLHHILHNSGIIAVSEECSSIYNKVLLSTRKTSRHAVSAFMTVSVITGVGMILTNNPNLMMLMLPVLWLPVWDMHYNTAEKKITKSAYAQKKAELSELVEKNSAQLLASLHQFICTSNNSKAVAAAVDIKNALANREFQLAAEHLLVLSACCEEVTEMPQPSFKKLL